ncbi:hypothetical protein PSTT_01465 [Puccinia striiformis]|uniref:Uncharacterized protein n=1 Tax=Puccinia striiformis TaxID=27350 RepID=A0A2S4W3M5_9BASI|nr:hypothetical protein PSTT_01465 [Puccinia striiformis]
MRIILRTMNKSDEGETIQEPDDSSNPTLSSSSTIERKDDQSKDQVINPHLLDDLLTSEIQNQVNACIIFISINS